jgi:hypothetical protein
MICFLVAYVKRIGQKLPETGVGGKQFRFAIIIMADTTSAEIKLE